MYAGNNTEGMSFGLHNQFNYAICCKLSWINNYVEQGVHIVVITSKSSHLQ